MVTYCVPSTADEAPIWPRHDRRHGGSYPARAPSGNRNGGGASRTAGSGVHDRRGTDGHPLLALEADHPLSHEAEVGHHDKTPASRCPRGTDGSNTVQDFSARRPGDPAGLWTHASQRPAPRPAAAASRAITSVPRRLRSTTSAAVAQPGSAVRRADEGCSNDRRLVGRPVGRPRRPHTGAGPAHGPRHPRARRRGGLERRTGRGPERGGHLLRMKEARRVRKQTESGSTEPLHARLEGGAAEVVSWIHRGGDGRTARGQRAFGGGPPAGGACAVLDAAARTPPSFSPRPPLAPAPSAPARRPV